MRVPAIDKPRSVQIIADSLLDISVIVKTPNQKVISIALARLSLINQ
jgi:hypothetical protein